MAMFRKFLDILYNKFIARFFSVLALLVAIQQILQYFGYEPFKDNISFFITLIVCVYLAEELIVNYCKKRDYETLTFNELDKSSPEALEEELKALEKNGYNEKILRARDSFSRNYMIEQKINKRIILGRYAENAAIKVGDKEKQAAILIDDLGYSFFLIKDLPLAEQKVNHGLEVAKAIPNYYWIAKAHRHKAAIYIEQKNEARIEEEIKAAFEAANSITNEKEKNEMLGGLLYNEAQRALKKNNCKDALAFLEQSENHRKLVGDRSRTVKTLSLKGKIFEKQEDYANAKDCYVEGLNTSERIERLDEVIRNHRGLARVYEKEKNISAAEFHRKRAEELSKDIYVPFEN